ncbi:hypothetical protein [Shewanella sp. OMA3-2]|uniref:hypothetical protein n=1 Tax=Shewanella sp. OMA3-2 TaxID=2908650 RepID=UPI001F2657A3|nr:hypothetical protein [Shewanella sp. OMA3-2]UJF20811.1 hypothetical protein L0B17_11570 [Shewanella sp. OMA3-2]
MNICWICGREATTREHRVKASDLRSIFGVVTQQSPLYTKQDGTVKILQSVKSNFAKYSAKICHHCNTTQTQKYDEAWSELADYLLKNQSIIGSCKTINAGKIFSCDFKQGILYCHLYLVKAFGCKIIDDKVPFDLSGFAECILSGKAHPDLYFSVDNKIKLNNKNYAATSPIQVIQYGCPKKVVYATWYYIIGKVPIKILYYVNTPPISVHGHMIHPRIGKKFLRLA